MPTKKSYSSSWVPTIDTETSEIERSRLGQNGNRLKTMESFASSVTGDNVPAGEYHFCLNLTNSTLLKMEDSGGLQGD